MREGVQVTITRRAWDTIPGAAMARKKNISLSSSGNHAAEAFKPGET